jgi:cytochrome c-type biogenesis protein CcmH/NrfF
VRRLALLVLWTAFSATGAAAASPDAASEDHAARIRPVSDSPPVAASEGWSREVERELMSPYCPGRSLIECPSPQATELRLWIQGQERAGVPRAEVEKRLFEQFGDQLLHSPRAEGWGLWAYLVPGGALIAGGVVVAVFLGRGGPPGPPSPPPRTGPADPDLEREIERELGES